MKTVFSVTCAAFFMLAGCTDEELVTTQSSQALNGTSVTPGDFWDRTTVNVDGSCTGTIINDGLILTAAHCICGLAVNGHTPFDSCKKEVRIEYWTGAVTSPLRAYIHPDYSVAWSTSARDQNSNDLAVIRLLSSARGASGLIVPPNTSWYPTATTPVTLVGLGYSDATSGSDPICNGGSFGTKEYGDTRIFLVADYSILNGHYPDERILLYTDPGYVHGCPGDSGGPMFNDYGQPIGVANYRGVDDDGQPYTVYTSMFDEQQWVSNVLDYSDKFQLFDIAHATPRVNPVYADRANDTNLAGLLDVPDGYAFGDFGGLGYDQMLAVNRGATSGLKMRIADFRDGQAPLEIRYSETYGQSYTFWSFLDAGDKVFAGDFKGTGSSQAMFINSTPGAAPSREPRVLITSFVNGTVPAITEYRSFNIQFDGWIDPDDAIIVGDFLDLGHDQGMFINRTPGHTGSGSGRVRIYEFLQASPDLLRYSENYGDSAVLNELTEPGDTLLAGDFLALGYDQVMFINNEPNPGTGTRRVRIADFKTLVGGFAVLRYDQRYGDTPLLDGWHDAEDVILAGNFLNGDPDSDQVLFINNETGAGSSTGYQQLIEFHSYDPDEILFSQTYGQAATDPSLSNVSGIVLGRFDKSSFVVAAANLRARPQEARCQITSLRRN